MCVCMCISLEKERCLEGGMHCCFDPSKGKMNDWTDEVRSHLVNGQIRRYCFVLGAIEKQPLLK